MKTKLIQNSPEVPDEILQIVFRDISISVIDQFWKVHIDRVLKLREGVQLRSLEQVNPLNIYINDSDKMFTSMIKNIAHQSVIRMMTVKLRSEPNKTPEEDINPTKDNQTSDQPILANENNIDNNEILSKVTNEAKDLKEDINE